MAEVVEHDGGVDGDVLAVALGVCAVLEANALPAAAAPGVAGPGGKGEPLLVAVVVRPLGDERGDAARGLVDDDNAAHLSR